MRNWGLAELVDYNAANLSKHPSDQYVFISLQKKDYLNKILVFGALKDV